MSDYALQRAKELQEQAERRCAELISEKWHTQTWPEAKEYLDHVRLEKDMDTIKRILNGPDGVHMKLHKIRALVDPQGWDDMGRWLP